MSSDHLLQVWVLHWASTYCACLTSTCCGMCVLLGYVVDADYPNCCLLQVCVPCMPARDVSESLIQRCGSFGVTSIARCSAVVASCLPCGCHCRRSAGRGFCVACALIGTNCDARLILALRYDKSHPGL